MAVVTRQFINQLIKDTDNTFNTGLYIGLGRSAPWPGVGDIPEQPRQDFEYGRSARSACQHVKIATGVSAAVTRQDWSSDTIYPSYDDNDQTVLPYVMNSNYEVFLCIQQGVNAAGVVQDSTVEPTVAALNGGAGYINNPIEANENELETADAFCETGYIWRHLFTLSQVAINRFLTLNYMPVTTFTIDPSDGDVQTQQYQIQQLGSNQPNPGSTDGTAGQILTIKVDDGGAGYSSSGPTATILGNGTGATATVDTVGGVIKYVRITNFGKDYDFASIALDDSQTPTEDATLRAVIGPRAGVETDPVNTLRANSIIVTTDFENDEFDTLLTENDFRQVLLIRDPSKYNSSDAFTGNTSKANRALQTISVTGSVVEDNEITGGNSNAKGILDFYDAATNNLYYHQTPETGYGTFQQGETVTQSTSQFVLSGAVSSSPANQTDPAIDIFSGELLYIDNISPIQRDINQTEDIKIVITF